MADKDKPLDAMLHRGLRALAATKGPCPSIEWLCSTKRANCLPTKNEKPGRTSRRAALRSPSSTAGEHRPDR